tara:strand:+ start:303 stop:1328 length:1026 start_codon:yes stop_codon:yes gene_type:complete
MAYVNQLSPIASSLGSFQLDGSYTSLNDMPNSLKKLIKKSNKIILVRESSGTAAYSKVKGSDGKVRTVGGGRTTGTMWYKGNILGFTVEDAVRDKKIQDVTAIPSTVKDPTKLSSLAPAAYNVVLGKTGSNYISKTYYKGQALRISSLSDPNGYNIFSKDVDAPENFVNRSDGVAFSGAIIHQGGSENASSGCIIFGTQRKDNGKVSSNAREIQALNKYLQEQGIVGKGKLNNLVIINLWEVPKDIPNLLGEIIDAETGRPIPGTEVKIDPLPVLSATSIDSVTPEVNELASRVPTQEELKDKGKEQLSKLGKKALKDANNPLSISSLKSSAGSILNFIKT